MRWHHLSDRERGVAESRDGGPDAAFWASPVGCAARAKLRGDRFFQIELDDATLTAYAETATPGGRRARRTCDLLGQIEELGWHLEHVSWWRVDPHDSLEPGPARHAAPVGPDADRVRGVYLFHAVPTNDTELTVGAGAAGGDVHAPTHRRDVS
jgi:hypothetical protein